MEQALSCIYRTSTAGAIPFSPPFASPFSRHRKIPLSTSINTLRFLLWFFHVTLRKLQVLLQCYYLCLWIVNSFLVIACFNRRSIELNLFLLKFKYIHQFFMWFLLNWEKECKLDFAFIYLITYLIVIMIIIFWILF